MEILFDMAKTLMYWLFGVLYIGIIMGVAWIWDHVFGNGEKTFTDLLIVAAIAFVPIVVGKVMSTSREEW